MEDHKCAPLTNLNKRKTDFRSRMPIRTKDGKLLGRCYKCDQALVVDEPPLQE